MLKVKGRALALAAAALMLSTGARANITLLDADGWKFLAGGFAEADVFHDSTQSLTEVVGNTAIAPNGYNQNSNSVTGDDGRTYFSIRNSRFDFTIQAPDTDNGWKNRGYMEFDFLGYDPQPVLKAGQATANVPSSSIDSESNYFENATLRIRHMYLASENGGWKILAGQYWDLFGFNPDYVMDTVSLSPERGDLYERTPQVTVYYTMGGDDFKAQYAVSMERPVQDDSEIPGGDAGIRLSLPSWTGAYTSSSSAGTIMAPASVAVSGKINTFEIPNMTTTGPAVNQDLSSTTLVSGEAIAVTALLPLLPTKTDDFWSSLVLTGEFTSGSGYADEFSGWSGGEKAFAAQNSSGAPNTAAYVPGTPNLDAGQGGYYNDNSFHLLNLESFNFTLQYSLPSTWSTYFDGGYSQLYSDNIQYMAQNPLNQGGTGQSATLNNKAAINSGFYGLSTGYFVNVFHDFSKQVRMGLEWDHFATGYVLNNLYAVDNRFQLSGYFRF